MKSFVKHIVNEIAEQSKACGDGLAHQNADGRVIVWNDDQGEDVSITDTKGNMFYIRMRDNKGIKERPVRTRGANCNTAHECTASLRLCAVWSCVDTDTLIKYLKKLLIDAKNSYNSYTIKSLSFSLTNDHYETIYSQETGGKAVRFSKGVKLVTIDFDLSFEYDPCTLENIELCHVV